MLSATDLRYAPVQEQQHIPLRESLTLIFYHLRLLNWWLFLLMFLGFLGAGGLLWLQLHTGGAQGPRNASELSRFVMESLAGVLTGVLTSALLVGDPLLELVMVTRAGIYHLVGWRSLLTFLALLFCSAAYLAWSLGNNISYAGRQGALFFCLLWLMPVLLMGTLSLLCSLVTRNAALALALAVLPLAGALLLQAKLMPIQAAHPFIIPYTTWGEQDAPDWWVNRLTLLVLALALAIWTWWLLRREEHLLDR